MGPGGAAERNARMQQSREEWVESHFAKGGKTPPAGRRDLPPSLLKSSSSRGGDRQDSTTARDASASASRESSGKGKYKGKKEVTKNLKEQRSLMVTLL